MLEVVAAYLFTALTAVVVLFQLALMFGAPWGELAMGGRFPGQLPAPMRVAALIQALVLSLLAVVVLIHSGQMFAGQYAWAGTGAWVVVGIYSLSLLMNLLTPSRWERIIWAPVVAVCLACALLVALG